MAGFLGKLFGGKKKADGADSEAINLVEDILAGLFERGNFNLSFDFEISEDQKEVRVEIFGEDEEMLKARDGQLLEAIQLLVKRVLQHQLPDDRVNVTVDCDGFRDQANDELIELAEKLKGIALSKGKSVYFRALPPKDRKVIHQYLAEDGRVKSRSIGDGHYKKIKIYPVKGTGEERAPV
jgi:spoIIIJ-associated protein